MKLKNIIANKNMRKRLAFILIATIILLIVIGGITLYFIKNSILDNENHNKISNNSEYWDGLRRDMEQHNEKSDKDKNKYLELAEKNATNYIKNKYGFEPIFVDKKAEYSTTLVGGTDDAFIGWKYNYSGNVLLNFNKDNQEYNVMISGINENIMGYDNYQYSQISNEVINEFNTVANSLAYNSEIQYGKSFGDNAHNLVNTYFDGHNLKEILENASIFMEYGNTIDLNMINVDFIDSDSEVLILKYKSDNDYIQAKEDYDAKTKESYGKGHLHIQKSDILGFDMPEKALHVQEYLAIENSKKEIKKINIIECDGLYAVQFGRYIPFEISTSKIDNISNFKTYGEDEEQLSQAYSINYEMSDIKKSKIYTDWDLFLYFPIEKLEDTSKYRKNDWRNRFAIGFQSRSETGKKKYNVSYCSVGDFQVIHYEGKEYLMIDFSPYYDMNLDIDYRFALLGFSVE